MTASNRPDVKGFFDPDTFTVSYVVIDPATKKAAIVDSVLNFNCIPKGLDSGPFCTKQKPVWPCVASRASPYPPSD